MTPEPPPVIRAPKPTDGTTITRIHQAGLATGQASFRRDAYGWDDWWAAYGPGVSQVAVLGDVLVGWAAVAPISDRCTYAGVGEVSVYVDPNHGGRGIGHALLNTLIPASEAAGYWTINAQIFPENTNSLALHEKAGFSHVGRRVKIGRMGYGPMAGQWRDVLLLERRSAVVGID
ncbi:MAG: N-acetyltransferase family protein [Pseudomonadota bacterium]